MEASVISGLQQIHPALANLSRDLYLKWRNKTPTAYVDVFVDDFLSLSQGLTHRKCHIRSTSFHEPGKILRPLDSGDSYNRKEILPLKKLYAGDCNWSTYQVLMGWVVNTVHTTLLLSPHQENSFQEILSTIPRTQKRTGSWAIYDLWKFPSPDPEDYLATHRKPYGT